MSLNWFSLVNQYFNGMAIVVHVITLIMIVLIVIAMFLQLTAYQVNYLINGLVGYVSMWMMVVIVVVACEFVDT